jgi:2-polyprenyl-3-methyl-5-hydroxy-6-metoxy-1,4-benzoquinol methylase
MEMSTARRLTELNQRFYAEHAENFADARPRLAAGVRQVLAAVAPGARVLEIGCGDGKVGRALARAGVGAYVGVDASEAMLDRAARFTTNDEGPVGGTEATVSTSGLRRVKRSFVFLPADLTAPAWPDVLPAEPFDWVLAFAVFHHLPGYDRRARVLKTLAEHLAPTGRVALSNWQLTRSDRLKQRIVPWSAGGLSDGEVEPGDYLVSWERKGTRGLRYVHLLDEAETQRMASQAGLRIVESFRADGVTGDLSDYAVMEHAV